MIFSNFIISQASYTLRIWEASGEPEKKWLPLATQSRMVQVSQWAAKRKNAIRISWKIY